MKGMPSTGKSSTITLINYEYKRTINCVECLIKFEELNDTDYTRSRPYWPQRWFKFFLQQTCIILVKYNTY